MTLTGISTWMVLATATSVARWMSKAPLDTHSRTSMLAGSWRTVVMLSWTGEPARTTRGTETFNAETRERERAKILDAHSDQYECDNGGR